MMFPSIPLTDLYTMAGGLVSVLGAIFALRIALSLIDQKWGDKGIDPNAARSFRNSRERRR